MNRRLMLCAASLLFFLLLAAGCTDLAGEAGCVSDEECKLGRICSTEGRCMWPQGHNPTLGEEPDADSTPRPDAGADASDGGLVLVPEDIGTDAPMPEPDVGPEPDTGPDVGPDAGEACPEARIQARVQGNPWQSEQIDTHPLNTVRLDGTQSSGDVVRYEWTVVERPAGSTQRLSPSNIDPTPDFFVDLMGRYVIELRVFDAEGRANCNPNPQIHIEASSSTDIHIQLVWDTPADPDQTDNFGADLDLHYLHPNGNWGSPPWDVYWRNTSPDWGRVGYSGDDPSLDIDDTNGAGPENLSHNRPENVRYDVGVYYFQENGFNTSYATVRVYIQGQLEFEQIRALDQRGVFWDVASITMPNGMVVATNRLYDGYP